MKTVLRHASFPPQSGRSRLAARDPIVRWPWVWIIIFILIHLPLALAMKRLPALATLHALATLGLGACWALLGQPYKVAWVGAYIVGTEVVWRSAGAAIFWETGKYGLALIFLLSLLRSRRLKPPPLILLYFLLLLPATLITIANNSLSLSRDKISFNLSGPFALMVSVIFFASLRLTYRQLLILLLALVAPVSGVAAICYSSTFGADDITFGASSSMAASGGFGPNQVSSTLGLGIVAAFICLMEERMDRRVKLVMLGAMLFFAIQSTLTLSRTGLYIAGLGILAAAFYLIRNARLRRNFLLVSIFLFLVSYFLVFPALDNFTGGAVARRFSNTGTTGRDTAVALDLQLWQEHFVFGVGAGQAKQERTELGKRIGSHTEFTRLLSEHGLFGATAFSVLMALALKNWRSLKSVKEKALLMSMLTVSFLFMMGTGMRLALPAFAFGLTSLQLVQRRLPAALRAPARWRFPSRPRPVLGPAIRRPLA